MQNSTYVIITSINPPTQATQKFSSISTNPVILVGDTKSPPLYDQDNTVFVSLERQLKSKFRLSRSLPTSHYSRKMMGYLEAISLGATRIVDTDDDNIPYDDFFVRTFGKEAEQTNGDLGFINVYSHFTTDRVWPRGLPLANIMDDLPKNLIADKGDKPLMPGVIQGLANSEPDLDAIFRLTQNRTIRFQESNPIILGAGTWSPFNSQNTVFEQPLFPLLYLPSTVTFRYTDILRSYVAQPIMWAMGYGLVVIAPTVTQERNPHDYFKDFVSEVPMYLTDRRVCEIALKTAGETSSIAAYLRKVYQKLVDENIVEIGELETLESWLKDLGDLGIAS